MTTDRTFGPNGRKLLIHFITLASVPAGGGLGSAMAFWTDAAYRHQKLEEALRNYDLAITAVRTAPKNPYGDDEETIAAAILAKLGSATS